MHKLIMVFILMFSVLPAVAAGSGSWHCWGTWHKSGTTDSPTAWDLPNVSAATMEDAKSNARHINMHPSGMQTDTLACEENPNPAHDPMWRGWCWEGSYRWEIHGRFPDKPACVKKVEAMHHCDKNTADCELMN